MSFNERNFATLFGKWVRDKDEYRTAVFELKCIKKRSINPISDFRPHQLPALYRVKHGCLYHKISDQSVGSKPFDSFKLCEIDAYVVILFYKPRKEKVFHIVDIDDFLTLDSERTTPYITEEEIALVSVKGCV